MLIRFWGTRGSIPVALTGAGVRSKIKQALLQANGRRFDDDTALEHFIDEELYKERDEVIILTALLPDPIEVRAGDPALEPAPFELLFHGRCSVVTRSAASGHSPRRN